ncbi:MAG: PAS domain S-box protein [Chitinophagaceae bacterium]|nr:PAS domain S-box protein [Chitinophagaceae bacterium]
MRTEKVVMGTLRILHLEDLPEDGELVARGLRKGGIDAQIIRVDNRDDFVRELIQSPPDLILSDHSLPSFDSHAALKIVKDEEIKIPFILVTATVSEEYAVNILMEGAADYILKDRLQRLPNAIRSALDKHRWERSREEMVETLRISERKYKLLFESNPMPMWMVSKSTLDIIAVNHAAINHYGFTREEFLQLNSTEMRSEAEHKRYISDIIQDHRNIYNAGVWRHVKKDGTEILVDVMTCDVEYENQLARLVLANDVTQKIKTEQDLALQRSTQQKMMAETSILVQEREREEIGKELHDNINQLLASSKLYMETAIASEGITSEYLDKSREHLLTAIEEIRKLSHTLIAPSLGNITLIQAVQQFVQDIHFTTSLHIELVFTDYLEEAINNKIKLMFYRIIQEQVNNILKHAKAKNAEIHFTLKPELIELLITDDGRGFDTSKTPGGIGLRNINTRAGYFDGYTRITSSPGKGCQLEVVVPRH